jgi:hypothetical protein
MNVAPFVATAVPNKPPRRQKPLTVAVEKDFVIVDSVKYPETPPMAPPQPLLPVPSIMPDV